MTLPFSANKTHMQLQHTAASLDRSRLSKKKKAASSIRFGSKNEAALRGEEDEAVPIESITTEPPADTASFAGNTNSRPQHEIGERKVRAKDKYHRRSFAYNSLMQGVYIEAGKGSKQLYCQNCQYKFTNHDEIRAVYRYRAMHFDRKENTQKQQEFPQSAHAYCLNHQDDIRAASISRDNIRVDQRVSQVYAPEHYAALEAAVQTLQSSF
eukprot:gb/GEZN01010168.1/.p1 GENE.gb/GEZN01010168.1/~~gb/GEZN01010168.1/.p1  ORF type:complete len:211 (+),score=26.45 gb/GEZN01010168.1/:485-1117(+)